MDKIKSYKFDTISSYLQNKAAGASELSGLLEWFLGAWSHVAARV